MADDNYSIKEFIAHNMKDIGDKIDEISTDVKEIRKQTTDTIGRVNRHDWYFKAIWWALGAAWSILLIGVPFLYKTYKNDLAQRDAKTKQAIADALEDLVSDVQYEK